MVDSAYDSHVRKRIEAREQQLSPFACKSLNSKGRVKPEPPPQIRGEYQRDRDRIIHTNAFRRLKHKTQVFIAPSGDHYVTRLTHTLEVTQIGRTIARALNLNEDLIEAIALGHDLGHTPFGHVGEEALDELSDTGFLHSAQSLRIVERLAKNGEGLNLTWEVREGVLNHSKPRGDFLRPDRKEDITLEAQICRASDAIAYLNHDIGDAIRAGILSVDDLPDEVNTRFGKSHASRINSLVCDIVDASWGATGEASDQVDAEIIMSADGRRLMNVLREFMFENVYMPINRNAESTLAREIMNLLYGHLVENPEQIPNIYFLNEESVDQAVVDYLSGMTDYYAITLAESIRPGISEGLSSRIIPE
ncbi:MAG: deoxyguanosinetriphosphate triphosphohydrolase [Dehalococcoidia bacterium]|nr:deoxyguanosinetriphosphate triphosphohydrolase [Dehalococcoidia bacterium]